MAENTYIVRVEAFGLVRILTITAGSCAEAIRKARYQAGISIDVRIGERARDASLA